MKYFKNLGFKEPKEQLKLAAGIQNAIFR